MAKYNTHWRNSRHRGTCKSMPCFFCKKLTKWRRVYAGQRRYVCYDCIPFTYIRSELMIPPTDKEIRNVVENKQRIIDQLNQYIKD